MITTTRRRRPTLIVETSDARLIDQIVERYLNRYTWADSLYRGCVKLEVEMDLTTCHANGSPLKLAELLEASDDDLHHDIDGVREHLDRHTGELLNCFSPRYSA